MSGSVGIEQVGQLTRCALLIGDRVVPGFGRISEMSGIEKVVVTIDLGFVEDRHHVSLRQGATETQRADSDPAERKRIVRLLPTPSPESLAHVEDMLGRHLERFGAKCELVGAWQRGGPEG